MSSNIFFSFVTSVFLFFAQAQQHSPRQLELQREDYEFLASSEAEPLSVEWFQERGQMIVTVAVLGGEAALLAWLVKFFKDEHKQRKIFKSVADLFADDKIKDGAYERFARILSEMGLSVVYVRDTSLKTLHRLLEKERMLFFYRECSDCKCPSGEKYFFVTRIEGQKLICFDLDSREARAECREKEISLQDLYDSSSGEGGKLSFLVFLQTDAAQLQKHPVIQKLIYGRCTPQTQTRREGETRDGET